MEEVFSVQYLPGPWPAPSRSKPRASRVAAPLGKWG